MEKYEICLQSLKHYNEGTLIFEWYDIDYYDNFGDMITTFIEFVKTETKDEIEEVMVADYSGFPNMGEYPNHDEVTAVMTKMKEAQDPAAVIAYIDMMGSYEVDDFEEAYQGEYDSMKDFAVELVDSCYDLDKTIENLAYYFDYEGFARDLEMGGDYSINDGYVFRNM